jgi:hypothetical protein
LAKSVLPTTRGLWFRRERWGWKVESSLCPPLLD